MKIRVITGVLITAITALFIVPGYILPFLPIFFFLVAGTFMIVELTGALKKRLPDVSQTATVFSVIGILIPVIPVLIYGKSYPSLFTEFIDYSPNMLADERLKIVRNITSSISYFVLFFFLFTFLSVVILVAVKGSDKIMDILITPYAGIYVVFPLFCAASILLLIPNGFLWMILGIISAWITDVFAFFAGVTFGKTKIVPHISPNKTWEGTIGGMIGSVVFVTLWMVFIMDGPDIIQKNKITLIAFGVTLGLILSIVAQLGDWFASILKRQTDVRDFGSILPGHGGILDRFDGVLFTYPVVLGASLFYYLV